MIHPGYRWRIFPEGELWCWRAEGRDDLAPVASGVARSRAEAAAFLIRAIARGVVADPASESRPA